MHSICAVVLQFAATFPTKSVDIRSCWQAVALHHCSSAPIQEVIPQKKDLEIVPNCRAVSNTINRQCNAGPIETMPCSNSAKFTAFMQDTGSVANRQRGLYPAELIRKIFTILGCPLSYFTVFFPAEAIRICINREMFRDCICKNVWRVELD